ncbi:MAG: phospho-N-acetylmuramoyl-pentapeptide-transferase [Clostridiaceae bacterium]|jgi:phospho-N-acetylmuramoyl-pentapeptide-transferase|nr:phospho-N-acetylmuramoyl-pentapeptide-transferase [Clostridiaceae bacterium]
MSEVLRIALSGVTALVIAAVIAPLVLRIARRFKAGQTVLSYMEHHMSKSGTPTMGGWIFIISACASALIFGFGRPAQIAAAIMLSYAIVGFLDDFIKVKFKQNMGLRAYQKIIAQLGIAVLAAVFCYRAEFVGTAIHLPFSTRLYDISFWVIPLVIFLFIAMTNAVNLTDGLDGLAGFTGAVYFAAFTVIIFLLQRDAAVSGDSVRAEALLSLAVFSASVLGGVLGFLLLNSYPAKIIMGDTGSLALGGAAATVAVFSREPLLIAFAGIMYVVSCISVIVQVSYYKLTKKRVFLMSPFHHHLEKKGWHEAKITAVYVIVTAAFGLISILAAGVV